MITIHINPNIENQVNYGTALESGFKQCGYKCNLTTQVNAKGDVHCIIGPWYAFNHYLNHDSVLYLDRACWEHPDYTLITWMDKGQKQWIWGNERPSRYHPEYKPWKPRGSKLVMLCDYGDDGAQMSALARPHFDISVRLHPSQSKQTESLPDCLSRNDIAMGAKTTALVTAAIEGLPVISSDPLSPVAPISSRIRDIVRPDRRQWLCDLSWHNWKPDEMAEAVNYFMSVRNEPNTGH